MTKQEKREYIQIAKDLHYPKETIEKIRNAKDENECSRILHTARANEMNKRP